MDFEIREPSVAYGKLKITIAEYLSWEKEQDHDRHEYLNGEIFAMAGAGYNHNTLFSNVFLAIGAHLKGKSCRIFGTDMRLNIPESYFFTYPDIGIYCNPLETSPFDNDTSINPTVLIELLSPSTKRYDMGHKFFLYKHIPTLMEYVLIDSKSYHIMIYRKQENGEWELEEFKNLTDLAEIKSIDLKMVLTDIYYFTNFNKD